MLPPRFREFKPILTLHELLLTGVRVGEEGLLRRYDKMYQEAGLNVAYHPMLWANTRPIFSALQEAK